MALPTFLANLSTTQWIIGTLIAAFLVVYFITVTLKRHRQWAPIMEIPGPTEWPFLGNAPQLATNENEHLFPLLSDWSHQTGNVMYVFWFYAGFPQIILSHPQAAKEVLQHSTNITKGYLYKFLHPWLGTGLLTSTNQKWEVRRSLLTPSFHEDVMNRFMKIFQSKAIKLKDLWLVRADNGKEFNPFTGITHMALDVINEAAMGVELGALDNENGEHEDSEYIKSIYALSELAWNRMTSPWLWPDWTYQWTTKGKKFAKALKCAHDFTREVIQKHREKFEREGLSDDGNLAFLDMLLAAETETGVALTDEDVQEEVDTFMFEGHDTTSSGMFWTIWLIGQNPECQAKAQEEVDRVLGDQECPTAEQLEELTYITYVSFHFFSPSVSHLMYLV
eukprot:TRINITY_DN2862_c0_g1_i2.p1 TRINITY_DN2862_c0_g1~~TRINITY_DN2862_c0_g1_i2.p1  ORF type:complete len:392 (+),score=103.49 TRINITY_DN2862_c0_g1_i2:56-1231(+)